MNTNERIPSTRVSDVARLMADETSCAHSVWYMSRYSGSLRTYEHGQDPIDRDPRRTSRIRETAAALDERGHEVHPSLRNHFEARGSRSGARVSGRPDLIACGPDGDVTVYDVRDGAPAVADDLEVRLHMYLLPRANLGRWRGSRPSGCILHADGTERRIAADEIDDEFVERVAVVMRQIAADEPAPHSPGPLECGRCPLTSEHCSERVEVEPRSSAANGAVDSPSTC